MSDVAIKVEGLGKRYKIGKLQRRHDTLRDRIADQALPSVPRPQISQAPQRKHWKLASHSAIRNSQLRVTSDP